MADVYGFNEAKSKIAVVDKATQDATDASQNSRMTALETKNTEQDNRLTAVEEALENAGGTVISSITVKSFSTKLAISAGSASVGSLNYSPDAYKNVVVSNTTDKRLNYSYADGKFYQYSRNIDKYSLSDSWAGLNRYLWPASFKNYISLTKINEWLQTLVGERMIIAENTTFSAPSKLYIGLGNVTFQSNCTNGCSSGTVPPAVYGSMSVSVSVDDNGYITSVGSISALPNIYLNKYPVCAHSEVDRLSWSAQEIDLIAVQDTASISMKGDFTLNTA